MASFVSEDVAAEKLDAMRRFERKRMFWKLLPVIEVIVVVLLLLYWLTPSVFAGEYIQRLISGGLTGGVFIFCVVNVLIAVILSLSNYQRVIEPDLYFQYVSSSAAAPLGGYSSDTVPGELSSSTVDSKLSASHDNEEKTLDVLKPAGKDITSVIQTTGEAPPVKREMVRAVSSVAETTQAKRKMRKMTSLSLATSESLTDHQVYRRSRSERIDMRGDIRRSMRRLCDIDDLSNDEFRSTVETFIAGKKKMLSKEWIKS